MLSSFPSTGEVALLAFGALLGLKHATEVDHVVAVSTIVIQHRSVWRSAIVGALWGVGHTIMLFIVGMGLLVFRVAIPTILTTWAELGVACMIVGFGVLAVSRSLRERTDVHLHRHEHDGQSHVHLHFHESGDGTRQHWVSHSHSIRRFGLKPLLIGAMHGVAGSATLTVLILARFESVWMSLWYLVVFGFGSVCGMLAMSGLIGAPFALVSRRFTRVHVGLQAMAGTLSVIFGLWYAFGVSTN